MKYKFSGPGNLLRDQRGLSLLEVLLSTVVLGIALTGFLMALSTATTTGKLAGEENIVIYLANEELEALKSANFENVPFLETSTPDSLEEVPDYFSDIAISELLGGDCLVVSSGDLRAGANEYSRDYAFDGKRANYNYRWMGNFNALAYVDTGGGPDVGGPGGSGPGIGGPGGGPDVGGDYRPEEYQYLYCAFPELTRISRILFDNRFNITEKMGAPAGDFDELPHLENIWQEEFDFFYTDTVLEYGDIYDPWRSDPTHLYDTDDNPFGSSGINVIFDDPDEPLEAGIVGLHNVDTYTDFDRDFHWPYASEIEIYGFNEATHYVEFYRDDDTGEVQHDNVVMYFPDYLGSGYDLGRLCYVEDYAGVNNIEQRKDLIRVILEFYPSSNSNLDETWQKLTWWQSDTSEVARFETTLYRDEPTRVDRLPNLSDLPTHKIYYNNEILDFDYTVPGASEIRARFGTFDLEPVAGSDTIQVRDGEGNTYLGPMDGTSPAPADWPWTPWIPGDTIVIHFESNAGGNTEDGGYQGFAIDAIEVRWVGVGDDSL